MKGTLVKFEVRAIVVQDIINVVEADNIVDARVLWNESPERAEITGAIQGEHFRSLGGPWVLMKQENDEEVARGFRTQEDALRYPGHSYRSLYKAVHEDDLVVHFFINRPSTIIPFKFPDVHGREFLRPTFYENVDGELGELIPMSYSWEGVGEEDSKFYIERRNIPDTGCWVVIPQ